MKVELNIKTGFKNNKTYLDRGYCTQAFKIANITEDKTKGDLQLMLMNSSPGILDGDEYNIKIALAEYSNLQLQTQSYQRLFNMKIGATQHFEAHLDNHSTFIYMPHPLVPHELSNFSTKNKIYLKKDCTLIWSDVLTCGRKLNGEVFKFSKLHSLTEIYFNNRLTIKENLFLEPHLMNLNSIGQLEGYSHQASLIYLKEDININEVSESINSYLVKQNDIIFGISETPINGLIVRILGQKAEQLYDCLKMIASILT